MSERYNIAIVGMGGIFPGANSLDQYWRNITDGRSFFTEMPKDRWNFDHFWSPDASKANRSYSKIGAFISNFEFPFLEYRLPPSTMKEVDLTQLVTLEATKQALRDAGIQPRDERLHRAICVLGLSGVDEWARLTVYLRRHDFLEALVPRLHERGVDPALVQQMAEQFGEVLDEEGYHYESTSAAVGAVPSSVSNRVAQVFGIRGFNMTVDAACASSMTSMQVACDALMAGDTRIAICGGADLGINPAIYIGFSRVSGVSLSGHANPFDHTADGLLIGEGVGIVVLKRLEDAMEDGDRIHAVIQGIGSSSDGAGNAIYAPSAEGRAECMRRALKTAGREPREVQYIEAHATSTIVGDGNEYDALGIAYGQFADPDHPVVLGSVKGQIGHLKAAAGAAGLIKTVLAMENRTIPHMPRFKKLTAEATYDGPGLVVPTEPRPWEPGPDGMRVAGVTASGFGGINYHVILEQGDEYPAPPPRIPIDRRLAIVAMSCRTPGARSPEELVDHLMAGDDLFSDVDHRSLGWHTHLEVPRTERITARRIGRIDDEDIDLVKFRIFPTAKTQIASAQLLGLALTDELLEQMHLDRRSPKQIAVSVGSMHNDHFGDIWMNMLDSVYQDAARKCGSWALMDPVAREESLEEATRAFMDRFPPSTEHTLPGWMTNCLSGRIANTFNFNGPNCVVDSACSSGLAAFMPAMYELAFGRSPMAIAGGINRSHNSEMTIGVTSLGAVSDDVACPFDINGHGFLMSEGGGLFVLKRLEDARRDGDTIYGTILSLDGSSEADSKSMVAPTTKAVRTAIRRAIRQAGVNPAHVGVVDVHGSANRASDLIEVEALAEELRPEASDRPVLVTAVKSHIGHLYGGSGVTSTMSVLGSLNRGMAPGIRNLTVPHPEVIEFYDRARPVQSTQPLPEDTRWGAVQSLGLGGANFVMVLGPGAVNTPLPSLPPPPGRGKARPATSPVAARRAPAPVVVTAKAPAMTLDSAPVESFSGFPGMLVMEAQDLEALRAIMKRARSMVPAPAVLSTGFEPSMRAVLTHSSMEDLGRKLDALEGVLASATDPRPLEGLGIQTSWAGPEPLDLAVTAGLAFCFPGQGTQYLGMGQCLYERYPVFRDTVNEVHALARERFGFDLIGNLYRYSDEGIAKREIGTLVGVQSSVFAIELATARLLEALGARPDVLIGHSFGEFAALTFAGAWDLTSGFEAVSARIEAAERSRSFGDLSMMSLVCDLAQREVLLSLAGAGVQLTNINAPTQVILAGPRSELERTQAMAEAAGAQAVILQIASAFHSRYMEPAREPFRQALESLPCKSPRIPVLSTVNGRHYPTAGLTPPLLAEHLSRQLVTGIDFPRDVSTLYRNGIRHFVEVGPKWSITRMVGAILEGRPFRATPTLQPKVGDAEMFERARSFLVATGHLDAHQGYGKSPTRLTSSVHVQTSAPRPVSARSPVVSPALPAATATPVLAEPTPAALVRPGPGRDASYFAGLMRSLLADRTGYPVDLLTDSVDLEGDLGIDSVLRAEIWSELLASEGLDPRTRPSKVRSIGELADVLARASAGAPATTAQGQVQALAPAPVTAQASAPVAALTSSFTRPGRNAGYFAERMRSRLAERTGYPVDLLTDSVDLEGDLGIDSVLRAEIWSDILATEGLDPRTRPSKVRSIGELADVLARAAEGDSRTPSVSPPLPSRVAQAAPVTGIASSSKGKDPTFFADLMRTRLAQKTGYPLDLLTDSVDLEGDLGIDSVLRAEIWSDILATEGLDPRTRPSKVRSIGELAKVLADASGAGISIPAISGATSMAARGVSAGLQNVAPSPVQVLLTQASSGAPATGKDSTFFAALMRTRLAQKTGYPLDLLTDSVDLEGDLGIDSVLRAEIWSDILATEGLDPRTRPSKVRSIGELAKVLADASNPAALPPRAPAPAPAPASAQDRPRTGQPEPDRIEVSEAGTGLSPCTLNRAQVVVLPEHEISHFACRHVLHFTGHPRSDEDVARMLAEHDVEVEAMDADEAAGDGATLDRMLERCDTVIFTAHGGLASGNSKAGRLASSLERETLKIFGVFRAIKRHLKKTPRRVLIPISIDGCFGIEDPGRNMLASFPAGFVLSLQRELKECTFQLIDTGARSWADALSEHLDIVVGLTMVGRREGSLVTVEHGPVARTPRNDKVLGRDDTVLVTGGARGIVFECVHALARATGSRVVLTGRTEPASGNTDWLDATADDIDAHIKKAEVELVRTGGSSLGEARAMGRSMRSQWDIHQNLGRMRRDGIDVRYEVCDVSSIDSLRKLLRKLARQGTKLTGVVHGAGVQRSAMIEDLPDERVMKTLETKINPLLVFADALDWNDIKLLVSFGSVTGAFGNEGQTDYALANHLLQSAGRVLGKEHPSSTVQTIEWTAWTGTGMVTEREAQSFRAQGLTVLETAAGVQLFLDAIISSSPQPQISVFNPGSAFTMPRARTVRHRRRGLVQEGTQLAHFSPRSDEFLSQHLLNGQPVVPGTFIVELFAEASANGHPAALTSVHFRRPMWIRRDDHTVEVVMDGNNLRALPEQRPDVPARALTNLQYASAVIGEPASSPELVPMADEEELLTLRARARDGGQNAFYGLLDDAFRDALSTGPIFRGLKATVNDDERCVGLIEVTPEARDVFEPENRLLFHPIVSDMAVQVASSWAMERLMVMAIPASVERVEMLGALEGDEALVCCRLVAMDEERTIVDLTVREMDGTPRFVMQALTLRSIARIDQ